MAEIVELSVPERLELIGKLWDSINDESAPLALSPEQVEELERRSAELEANPAAGIPWDEAMRQLRGRKS